MVGDIITEYASQCIPNIWIHQCQMPSTKRYYCASWPERQYVVQSGVSRTNGRGAMDYAVSTDAVLYRSCGVISQTSLGLVNLADSRPDHLSALLLRYPPPNS